MVHMTQHEEHNTDGAGNATSDQLRLIDGGLVDDARPQWRLDAETIALGRAGIEAARAALRPRAQVDDLHAA